MRKISTCISLLLPVFFTTLAIIIWATIFQLPIVPAILLGIAAGVFIAIWYTRCVAKAKKSRQSNLRECVHTQITFLSIVLFADLFASMLVWSFMELL